MKNQHSVAAEDLLQELRVYTQPRQAIQQAVCGAAQYEQAGLFDHAALCLCHASRIYGLCGQYNEAREYAQSAYHMAMEAGIATQREAIRQLAWCDVKQGAPLQGYTQLHSLMQEYQGSSAADLRLIADYGLSLLNTERLQQAEDILHQAAILALNRDDMDIHAEILGLLAATYVQQRHSEKALAVLHSLMEEYGLSLSPMRTTVLYVSFASIFLEMGQTARALEYSQQGLAIAEREFMLQAQAAHHSNCGRAYFRLGNSAAALRHYAHSRDIRMQTGDLIGLTSINHRIVELYEALGDFEGATLILLDNLEICQQNQMQRSLAGTLVSLGSIYASQQKFQEALDYFARGIEIREHLPWPLVKDVLNAMADCCKSMERTEQEKLLRIEAGLHQPDMQMDEQRIQALLKEIEHIRLRAELSGLRSKESPLDDSLLTRVLAVNAARDAAAPARQEGSFYKIQTLGAFRVFRQGHEIPAEAWKRKRFRDIFKILLIHYGKPVTIEKITDILWGYDAPENALNIIWSAISAIRSVLNTPSEMVQPLKAGDKSYTLDFGDNASIDFLDFRALLARKLHTSRRIDVLEQACNLYNGDFLAADTMEEWTEFMREDLKSMYISALMELSDLYTASGNIRQAVATARRVLHADSTYDRAYATIVRSFVEEGNQREADVIMERCKKEYEREFGDAPPQWLLTLHQGKAA